MLPEKLNDNEYKKVCPQCKGLKVTFKWHFGDLHCRTCSFCDGIGFIKADVRELVNEIIKEGVKNGTL